MYFHAANQVQNLGKRLVCVRIIIMDFSGKLDYILQSLMFIHYQLKQLEWKPIDL